MIEAYRSYFDFANLCKTAPEVASTKPHVHLLGFRKILCDCSLAMTMGSESPTLSPTQSSLPSLWTIKTFSIKFTITKISKWWNHILKQKPCHHQNRSWKSSFKYSLRKINSLNFPPLQSGTASALGRSFFCTANLNYSNWIHVGSKWWYSTDSTPSDSMGTPPVMLYSCRFTFLPPLVPAEVTNALGRKFRIWQGLVNLSRTCRRQTSQKKTTCLTNLASWILFITVCT